MKLHTLFTEESAWNFYTNYICKRPFYLPPSTDKMHRINSHNRSLPMMTHTSAFTFPTPRMEQLVGGANCVCWCCWLTGLPFSVKETEIQTTHVRCIFAITVAQFVTQHFFSSYKTHYILNYTSMFLLFWRCMAYQNSVFNSMHIVAFISSPRQRPRYSWPCARPLLFESCQLSNIKSLRLFVFFSYVNDFCF